MNACTDDLKLVALDKDDIEVVSAHLQDALVKVGDIFWQPREHRFMMAPDPHGEPSRFRIILGDCHVD